MLLGAILAALIAATTANVVTSNTFSGHSSSRTELSNGQSQRQWTIGDLFCYIAEEEGYVMKQCRKGLLGRFHPMLPQEEAIILAEIRKERQAKAQINAGVTFMQKEMQRRLQGMQDKMLQMQQQMQAAFAIFG